jgi:alpha-galactosidase
MQLNRQRIANLRLTAGDAAVHADMLEWHPTDTPEGAALPILSSMFGVIQYSMMLRNLPESHREVVRNWLGFSQKHRATLMKGRFRAYHPEAQYPILEAESDAERIIGVYTSGIVVPCGKLDRSLYVLNGTLSSDVVVDSGSIATAKVFDALGRSVRTQTINRGVQCINIPQGGFLSVSKCDVE